MSIKMSLVCVNRRAFLLILIGVIILGTLVINNISKKQTSYKAKAQELPSYCKSIGLYDLPKEASGETTWIENAYYDEFCKKNEGNPEWNGAFGEKGKCYTETGLCARIPNCNAKRCLAFDDIDTCLYKEVAFNLCVLAKKAPKQAAPDYVEHRCTTNCTEDIAIGDCVPGYALRCVCEGTRPRYRDDAKCAPSPKPAQCLYGGSIVTVDSSPYKYETKTGRFCIVDSKSNKKIAFHCRIDGKNLVQGNAVSDKEGYCTNPAPAQESGDPIVPNTYCGSKHEYWKANKSGWCIVDYGECTADKQWICRCDDAGLYNYPTVRNNPEECP